MANSKILTAEQEKTLRQPIEEYVGKIQKEIDELRKDGTAKVIMYQSRIENVKRDKTLSKGEKDSEIASCQKELEQAKAVEAQNKDQIAKLIGKAENYLKNNFDKYYNAVKASCIAEKEQALQEHQQKLAKIEKEHKETLAKTSAQAEVKEENYVYKNRVSNEKIELEKEYQKVHIHRTVISRYQKEKGLCRILCESAVEYEEMTEYEKTPEMQSELHSNLIQTVYETELVYVYEDAKTAGAAVSLICPNCGAPIQKLGLKKCEYCGSVLEVQNKKAWRLLEMREK